MFFTRPPKPADFGGFIYKPLNSLSRYISNVIYEIQGKYETEACTNQRNQKFMIETWEITPIINVRIDRE